MEELETTEETTLMSKNLDDLTVGDALKINAIAAAIPLAAFAVIFAGATAYDKLSAWNWRRKYAKSEDPEGNLIQES